MDPVPRFGGAGGRRTPSDLLTSRAAAPTTADAGPVASPGRREVAQIAVVVLVNFAAGALGDGSHFASRAGPRGLADGVAVLLVAVALVTAARSIRQLV